MNRIKKAGVIALSTALVFGASVYDTNGQDTGNLSSGATSYTHLSNEDEGYQVVAGATASINDVAEVLEENGEVKEKEAVEEPVVDEWQSRLMVDVDESCNVRVEPSAESERVGALRKGDVAEITETLDGWYKIVSGELEGYVSAEYCVVGDGAKEMSKQYSSVYAISSVDGLRVRAESSTDADYINMLDEGEKLAVAEDAETVDGWVAVSCNNQVGYVSSEYVKVDTVYSRGITVAQEEEIAAKLAAQKAAEEAANAKNSAPAQKSQGASVAAGVDDVTLLAALIQCEAGGGSYDGLLAVGSVVANRAKQGYGGGSIQGVIYDPGQFTPAGSLGGVIANGVDGACVQAAQEALSGVDNTGGAVSFRAASSGHSGTVIGGNVFF